MKKRERERERERERDRDRVKGRGTEKKRRVTPDADLQRDLCGCCVWVGHVMQNIFLVLQ